MRRFSLCYGRWLGASVLTLVAATSGANAQGTLNVTATAGASAPDWAAVSTDESLTPLSASVSNPPTASSGCTLNAPNWSWIIDTTTNQVQYSTDGSSWSPASGGYNAWIVQPDPTSSSAVLHVIFMLGGYWQFPCKTGVGYNDNPCGDSWTGTALAMADPKSVKLLGLTVVSGATQTNVTGATNWAAVRQEEAAPVLIQASIQPDNLDAAAKIQWTGGYAGTGTNAKQRNVDSDFSEMTPVTAQIGPDRYTVNIWIIWATIENQVTGTTPANAVQFGTAYDGTENLGVQAYDDGNAARGKVVPIATVTPSGVNAVLTGGFKFGRDKWRHDFEDGAKVADRYDANWSDDPSDRRLQAVPITTDALKPLMLDANDKCYDRDAPSIDDFGQTYSYERYDNFREYLQWNDIMCSDYAGWYYKTAWVKNDTGKNQVKLDVSVVNQGALDLTMYTAAKYPPP